MRRQITILLIFLVAVCSFKVDPAPPPAKIFKGTINDRYTVTMMLQFRNGHLTGAYYYGEKAGGLLPLFGRTSGDSIIIDEYVAELNGTFSGRFKPDTSRISGTWKNSADTKRFRFQISYVKDTALAPLIPTGSFTYSALAQNTVGDNYSITQYAFNVSISDSSGTTYRCIIRRNGLGAMEGESVEDTLENLNVDYRIITGTADEQSIIESFGTGSITMALLPTDDVLVNGLVHKRDR
ncbi:MAG: hypothetical protein JW913_11820 [Chitinispirillaceae bacterium]|nr:hypothetical protein [Chitinispirillaceae bacterium]